MQNKLYSNSPDTIIDDYGIISIMYHRFEENKYPSTNIKNKVFIEHLNQISKHGIDFLNPSNFKEIMNRKKDGESFRSISGSNKSKSSKNSPESGILNSDLITFAQMSDSTTYLLMRIRF